MFTKTRVAALFITALAAAGCADPDVPDREPVAPSVIDTVHMDFDLHTFHAAYQLTAPDTGLDATLTSPGSYTLFAPTNAAFDALAVELGLGATGMDLITHDNRDMLAGIVSFHVVDGEVGPETMPIGSALETRDASNGIVHVIDRVMVPPAPTAQ